jgi:hAT family C-terminal dimerisation region
MLASAVDPRMRHLPGIPPLDKQQVWKAVEDKMVEIYAYLHPQQEPPVPAGADGPQVAQNQAAQARKGVYDDFYADYDGGIYNDPLKWWKDHNNRFPLLAELARRLLCIPATSAPSERIVSYAGLTISKKRAALSGDNAAMLVFLRETWTVVEDYNERKRRRLH